MFLQKFYISINKQARPITNFNDEVTKLPSGDDITRFDGIEDNYRNCNLCLKTFWFKYYSFHTTKKGPTDVKLIYNKIRVKKNKFY
jgi:hypothetical protein